MADKSQSISRSSSISYSDLSVPKTCIIINNLTKGDFVVDSNKPQLLDTKRLSLADQIKLSILNHDDYIQKILNWSNLPFLNRIIIIFDDELLAQSAHTYLSNESELLSMFPYIKISLQENLLRQSKSTDNLTNLGVTTSLEKFKNFHNDPNNEYADYNEPEPKQFNVLSDLAKLGIDLTEYNNDEQIQELRIQQDEEQERSRSRSLSLKRPDFITRRSSTKTLFKPGLHVKTDSNSNTLKKPQATNFPTSPTITLDETF